LVIQSFMDLGALPRCGLPSSIINTKVVEHGKLALHLEKKNHHNAVGMPRPSRGGMSEEMSHYARPVWTGDEGTK
jgi:hypothetical protein